MRYGRERVCAKGAYTGRRGIKISDHYRKGSLYLCIHIFHCFFYFFLNVFNYILLIEKKM